MIRLRLSFVVLLESLLAVTPMAAQTSVIEGIVHGRRAGGLVVYLAAAGPTVPAGVRSPAQPRLPFIDQVRLRFVPTVLAIESGTTVEFRNSDPILHNVFSPQGPGPGFDLGNYPRTEARSYTFSEVGTHVILCHVHPEMYAFVVVVPTPYHAVTDEGGRFRIEHVPRGTFRVAVVDRREEAFSREVGVEGGGLIGLDLDLSTGDLEIRDQAP